MRRAANKKNRRSGLQIKRRRILPSICVSLVPGQCGADIAVVLEQPGVTASCLFLRSGPHTNKRRYTALAAAAPSAGSRNTSQRYNIHTVSLDHGQTLPPSLKPETSRNEGCISSRSNAQSIFKLQITIGGKSFKVGRKTEMAARFYDAFQSRVEGQKSRRKRSRVEVKSHGERGHGVHRKRSHVKLQCLGIASALGHSPYTGQQRHKAAAAADVTKALPPLLTSQGPCRHCRRHKAVRQV